MRIRGSLRPSSARSWGAARAHGAVRGANRRSVRRRADGACSRLSCISSMGIATSARPGPQEMRAPTWIPPGYSNSYPELATWVRHSSGLKVWSRRPMMAQSASRVRAPAFRSPAVSLVNACSTGFKSAE
jgi:hypothetical protein